MKSFTESGVQVVIEFVHSDTVSDGLRGENAVLPELSVSSSDGFCCLNEAGFTKILSNPRYHSDSDSSVGKHFILKGFNRLDLGGEISGTEGVAVSLWQRKVTVSERLFRDLGNKDSASDARRR